MPEISRFYGIVISIRFADHAPPHFHASYQGTIASIAIQSLEVIGGKIPDRALDLVIKWANIHRVELLDDWRRASAGLPVKRIEPLR